MALAATVPSSLSMLMPAPALIWSPRPTLTERRMKRSKKRMRVFSDFGHLIQVVRKDRDFLNKTIGRGVEWANGVFKLPYLRKTLDDVLWFRPFEDPNAPPFSPCPWPRPFYPELSGVDLLMADLKALEAYASYFYHLPKIWSRPLPEFYDPGEVTDYFNSRPHLVALRLIEVFSSFAFAAIRIQILGRLKLNKLNTGVGISTLHYDFGMVLKETMLSLGATFIKAGQSLSTRPDIIGSEVSKALSELHDRIPPFPRAVAVKIIEEELGSPMDTFFSYLSEKPVAAASFGQVYRGTTVDGDNVAVKVQRPNLGHLVVRDIYILRLGLGLVQKIAKRKNDLRLYADELGKGFVGELDYTMEAANADEFQEAHSPYPFIRVPKVFHHLSCKRVLTMEWMAGENPSDLLLAATGDFVGHSYSERQRHDARRHLLDLVNKGVEASLIQLLETGLLHADPHAGNLRYTDAGEIGFLDFGLICRMEKKHQFAMLASIVHIVNGDWPSLVRALSQMDVVRPGTNIWRVTRDLEDSLSEVTFTDGIPDVKFSRVLGKIWSVALKYHFRMPAYYTLVLRSLASLEGLAVAADKNFKTFEAAYPYVVQKLLTDNSSASRSILHSVVLNRKKEFQWQRLASFLRAGTTRRGRHEVKASDRGGSAFDVSNLILKLLPSKDGVVLRRLVMTADGTSLIQALVSREGMSVRQHLCRVVADIMHSRIIASVHGLRVGAGASPGVDEYRSILGDRRLKVVFYKLLESVRKYPVLMLRFGWASLQLFLVASALACRRLVGSLFYDFHAPRGLTSVG